MDTESYIYSEWVSDWCLTPTQQEETAWHSG